MSRSQTRSRDRAQIDVGSPQSSSQDDVDAVAQRKQLGLADRPHVALTSTAEAPPPYSELVSASLFVFASLATGSFVVLDSSCQLTNRSSLADPEAGGTLPQQSPRPSATSQIPRRVRPVHEARARVSVDRPCKEAESSAATVSMTPLGIDTFVLDSSLRPLESSPRDPLAGLSSGPAPEFQPYSSPKLGGTPLQNGEPAFSGDRADDTDFDFDEEDEEMKAVSERLRTLIETGRDALASRPREWSSNTDSSTTTFATRSRLSTGSSLSTAATAAGASPRIPSPLAPHASKFETPQAQADFTLTDSSRHSRRKSLDAFSRIPRSSPALYDPSSSSTVAVSRDDAARTSSRGHRSSQSHGGGSHNPRHSLGAATERGEGVADEFAKVLDAARRSRRSTGA